MGMTFKNPKDLGEFMRLVRQDQDIKLYEMEEVLGIAQSTISRAERNYYASPSWFVLKDVFAYLGYDIEYKVTKRCDNNERG